MTENESEQLEPPDATSALKGEAPFSNLGPDLILSAVEAFDRVPDGRFIALNSYENRVYQIGIEDETPVIAKFYRPARWSDAQILEEHAFAIELGEQEIPVAVPMSAADGSTLVHQGGYRVALFPRLAGDWPDLDRAGRLTWLGRFLGRIHAVGQSRAFVDRPSIDVTEMGRNAAQFLLTGNLLPVEQRAGYQQVTEELLAVIDERIQSLDARRIRLHGDCHPSNVLWSDNGPSFVDLDDCRSGPAVQDLWMLVSGEAWEQQSQLEELLEGYRVFADFDRRELELVEPLRSLRMVYYAGWLARRWNDPAFPLAFPWFGSHGYWRDHVDDLRNQLNLLTAPASAEQY
ncbi:MAG: Ser/Thr protein kinase RdoA (MazF antagonist) [Gammaproteobacteria bacterium]